MKEAIKAISIRYLILSLLFLVVAFPVSAQHGDITLLAVSEGPSGLTGSVAHLYLDIQPGSGRVFMDTLPTAKIDTQLSTRFAKDMACKYLNIDCSSLDFFYTIRADSPIVGGPSAGAAITVLTISLLGNIRIDNSTAITGTINSGELIGPVGGVKQKIDAAASAGIKKVLIPEGEGIIEIEEDTEIDDNSTRSNLTESNRTEDMIQYGKNKSIEVIEVSSVDDALYHYTGRSFNRSDGEVEISAAYKDTMRFLSDELCKRSASLKKELAEFNVKNASIIDKDFNDQKKKAENLSMEGASAFEDQRYYSAASYCFGANVKYSSLIFRLKDPSEEEINKTIESIQHNVTLISNQTDAFAIKTITDLQAYMIVKDRLGEADAYINRSRYETGRNKTESALPEEISYAIERYYSALSWSSFLGQNGKVFKITKAELMRSCLNKISEAEEQYNYVDYLFRGILREAQTGIDSAKESYNEGDYALCLYKATLTKAQIDIVSSSMGIRKDEVDSLLNRKLDAARRSIITQQKNGIFPILGYSYYEYAQSLSERDVYSALLYSEYALELSNLDIYFEPEKVNMVNIKSGDVMIFFSGLAIGGMLMAIIIYFITKKKKQTYKVERPKHLDIKFDFKRK